MRKFAVTLSILLVLGFLLLPATVFAADSLATNCKWETVKWEDNPLSCKIYLNNWGRTPLESMSRLAGLSLPTTKGVASSCMGNCASANDLVGNTAACITSGGKVDAACPTPDACGTPIGSPATACSATAIFGGAHCCCQWGVSLAFSNRSWAGDTLTSVFTPQTHPLYTGIGTASDRQNPKGGGDWGITGSSFSQCSADTWGLTCNMDTASACIVKK
jgi:hypothetical protein